MKTYCYAAACVLGKESWSGFIYKLMRNYGVSPISNKMFATSFPESKIAYREPRITARRLNSEIITIERFEDHY
jgi:hypothetical protein